MLGGALAVAACPRVYSVAPSALFPTGVTAGDARTDSVLLSTLYTGTAPVTLALYKGTQLVNSRIVAPSQNGFAEVLVDGLLDDTPYEYVFSEDPDDPKRSSQRGRFRTAFPESGLHDLRIGAVSCLRQTNPMPVLERVGERTDLSAFLLLGDTVYVDGSTTLEQYRSKWHEGLTQTPHVAARAAQSVIATWDDHEILNDANEEKLPATQLAAARTAFLERIPTRRDATDRVWRSIQYGKTLEVLVLDCRSERRPSAKEYISPAQMEWLKQRLSSSPAMFKVIMNSVPITSFGGALWQPFSPDRWEGYPLQREEILTYVDEKKIPGVLWVSGDFHLGLAGRVDFQGPGAKALEVLVGPGSSDPNPSPAYPFGPQWDFTSGRNTYSTFDFNVAEYAVDVDFRDSKDQVLFAKRYVLG